MSAVPASHPFAPPTTLVIVNPVSGNPTIRQRARRLTQRLRTRGYEVAATERAGHGTELAREAARAGRTGIIVIGGDGTLCEIIAELPIETALAYFPAGSGNNFAFNLHLPQEPERWLALLDAHPLRAMHFGLCNGRPFASVASVGFDAQLVRNVPSGLKKRLHKGAYLLEFIPTYFTYRAPRFHLTIDGQPWNGDVLGVIVGRGPHYGGPHPVLPECDPGDDQLGYLVMEGHSKWLLGKFGVGVLFNNLPHMKGVTCGMARTVEVETEPASYVQLDGDLFGTNPVTFSVEPSQRLILAP
jgi:YegS/Rv2252/BmrU family lipid kinase